MPIFGCKFWLCVYESHSMNKVNFTLKTRHILSKKNFFSIFQYNLHSLKHIFHNGKQAFIILQHKNLWTEFLAIYSQCSSLYHHLKTLFHAEFFFERGGLISGNQSVSDLDCKKVVATVPNQTDGWFSLFLLQYEALYFGLNILRTQQQLTLEKARSSCTILYAIHIEIPSCSEMSSIVTFPSVKMNALTESTISGVLTIVNLPDLSTFWILFQLSLKIFWLKHVSPYTSHILL